MNYTVMLLTGLASVATIMVTVLAFAKADKKARQTAFDWTKSGANAALTLTMTLGSAWFLFQFFAAPDGPLTRSDLAYFSVLVFYLIVWPANWLIGRRLKRSKERLARTIAMNEQLERMLEQSKKTRELLSRQ